MEFLCTSLWASNSTGLNSEDNKMCETVRNITQKPLNCLCGNMHACKYTAYKRENMLIATRKAKTVRGKWLPWDYFLSMDYLLSWTKWICNFKRGKQLVIGSNQQGKTNMVRGRAVEHKRKVGTWSEAPLWLCFVLISKKEGKFCKNVLLHGGTEKMLSACFHSFLLASSEIFKEKAGIGVL